jgi:hypothetical protein
MGDAVNAVSSQIGNGMNMALAETTKFDEILDSHNNGFGKVFETFFSKECVKEGNTLTDMSFYSYYFAPSLQLGGIKKILECMILAKL